MMSASTAKGSLSSGAEGAPSENPAPSLHESFLKSHAERGHDLALELLSYTKDRAVKSYPITLDSTLQGFKELNVFPSRQAGKNYWQLKGEKNETLALEVLDTMNPEEAFLKHYKGSPDGVPFLDSSSSGFLMKFLSSEDVGIKAIQNLHLREFSTSAGAGRDSVHLLLDSAIVGCTLEDCSFVDAACSGMILKDCTLKGRTSFAGAKMQGAFFKNVEIDPDSTKTQVSFNKANFEGAVFANSSFRNASFVDASLEGAIGDGIPPHRDPAQFQKYFAGAYFRGNAFGEESFETFKSIADVVAKAKSKEETALFEKYKPHEMHLKPFTWVPASPEAPISPEAPKPDESGDSIVRVKPAPEDSTRVTPLNESSMKTDAPEEDPSIKNRKEQALFFEQEKKGVEELYDFLLEDLDGEIDSWSKKKESGSTSVAGLHTSLAKVKRRFLETQKIDALRFISEKHDEERRASMTSLFTLPEITDEADGAALVSNVRKELAHTFVSNYWEMSKNFEKVEGKLSSLSLTSRELLADVLEEAKSSSSLEGEKLYATLEKFVTNEPFTSDQFSLLLERTEKKVSSLENTLQEKRVAAGLEPVSKEVKGIGFILNPEKTGNPEIDNLAQKVKFERDSLMALRTAGEAFIMTDGKVLDSVAFEKQVSNIRTHLSENLAKVNEGVVGYKTVEVDTGKVEDEATPSSVRRFKRFVASEPLFPREGTETASSHERSKPVDWNLTEERPRIKKQNYIIEKPLREGRETTGSSNPVEKPRKEVIEKTSSLYERPLSTNGTPEGHHPEAGLRYEEEHPSVWKDFRGWKRG